MTATRSAARVKGKIRNNNDECSEVGDAKVVWS